MTNLSYSQLARLSTFEERFDYLSLTGVVGDRTFGGERWMNQDFYRSLQWKQVRNHVIARDMGCDLGVEGYEIFDKVIIHHMNPMSRDQVANGDPITLDPEYLITVTHNTHNAIHYGDKRMLPSLMVERHPGDTNLWA
jgi:hypothetical protein